MNGANVHVKEITLAKARSLRVGQAMRISIVTLQDCFGGPWGRPPLDDLLEQLPGSNFGAYRTFQEPITRDILLTCHDTDGVRVRHDWDRRHLPL